MKYTPLKLFFLIMGILCIGLGLLGVFLPVLPTTPFIIAAAFFFARSNHAWREKLIHNKIFGAMIRDWEQFKGIRREVKYKAIVMMLLSAGIIWFFTRVAFFIKIISSLTLLIVSIYIFTRPEPPKK